MRRIPAGLRRAFQVSVPVLFGYVPMGMAFGLLFTKELGLPWYYAALSGLIVYAGAAQFLSVGLLAAGAGLTEIFIATLLLNLRHVFYGFSLLHRVPEAGPRRLYSIFGLTDETYSVLTAKRLADKKEDEAFCFELTWLNHSYWVAGCALGALAGSRWRFDLKGFDFVLTALFAVLTVEQALATRRAASFIIAAAAAVAALLIHPGQMLLVSLALVSAVLLFQSARAGPGDA